MKYIYICYKPPVYDSEITNIYVQDLAPNFINSNSKIRQSHLYDIVNIENGTLFVFGFDQERFNEHKLKVVELVEIDRPTPLDNIYLGLVSNLKLHKRG